VATARPSSPSSSASAGTAGSKGKPRAAATAEDAAATTTAATAAPGAAKRRVRALPIAIVGALAAGLYGHFVLAMRFGPPLVMVGLGGLTIVLAAFALWRVVDPLTRGEMRAAPERRAPHRIRELEREKQAVLKAIKEIELDYQMRKIAEADYREMIERYRARALRVMGDLAAGEDYRALIERELKDRMAIIKAAAGASVAASAAFCATTL